MKKTIILLALMICALFYAQNNEFANYSTNTELLKIKKSVKPEQKKEFYAQYMKNDLVQVVQNTFTYKKYSNSLLRKFADTIMNYDSTYGRSEQTEQETINKLDQIITLKNKKDEINENLTNLLGNFPNVATLDYADEHTAAEIVPGRIFKLFYWGGGRLTTENYYKVNNDNLENISVIPGNESFSKTLNKITKNKNIDFYDQVGRSSTTITNYSKDNTYTINATIYNEDDAYSTYGDIKYTTKDFKTFTLVAFKPSAENAKWSVIE